MRRLDKQPQGGAMGVSVGSATIVMVFAVVALTLLAIMTLLTARREHTLAQRAAQAVTDYYAADTLAVEIFEELRAGTPGPAAARAETYEAQDDAVYYTVAIDQVQQLQVDLRRVAGRWQVLQWQVGRSQEVEIEDSLDLWDGEPTAVWTGPVA